MRHAAILTALVTLSSACAIDPEDLGGSDDESLAGNEAPDGDGKSDAAFDALSAELTAKYGLRPRRYNGFFNNSNESERRFKVAMPTVTHAINERAQANGVAFRFTEAELATNFITEGGYYLLDLDIHDTNQIVTIEGQTGAVRIDGYTFLGTDTIVDNAAAVSPWLSPELRAMVADPARKVPTVNEKGENVNTIFVDTIEQGIELNAAMFAWSRALASADAKKLGKTFETLPAEARFYWTTMYFNAGPGFAAGQMKSHGVTYWKTKWTSGDDPAKYSGYARYNVMWRTSSWELMSRTVLPAM